MPKAKKKAAPRAKKKAAPRAKKKAAPKAKKKAAPRSKKKAAPKAKKKAAPKAKKKAAPRSKKKAAPRASRSGTGMSSIPSAKKPVAHPDLAIYAGSFDPITTGHVDIIRRACNVFPKVRVAVAYNPNKEEAMFSPQERIQMIYDSLPELAGRVEADAFTGLLIDYARRAGAAVLVRGLRAVSDFEYEFQMTMMNRHLCPELETVFLMAGEQHFYTSSRLVKEVASFGGDVSSFVPAQALARFNRKLERLRAG